MIKPRHKQAHLQLLTFLKFDFGVRELRFAQRQNCKRACFPIARRKANAKKIKIS